MGMTIDDAIKYYSNKNVVLTEEEAEANTIALNTMRKYQMFQDQSLSLYMERLKADLVAMLTDIQLEIAELPAHVVSNQKSIIRMEIAPSAEDVYEIIQQKINALKADRSEDDE